MNYLKKPIPYFIYMAKIIYFFETTKQIKLFIVYYLFFI